MKIRITKILGTTSITFEIDEAKPKDALFSAGVLASMPTRCKCGSEDVMLSGNRAKGYLFVKVVCNKCGARAQLGEYKEGGFYWKDWEVYQPQAQGDRSITPEGEALPPPEGY